MKSSRSLILIGLYQRQGDFEIVVGWAFHPSLSEAMRRAFLEATERTILQRTFFKEGWAGFRCVSSDLLHGYTLHSLVSRFGLGNFGAGIVMCKMPETNGATFGYMTDRKRVLGESEHWYQALAEAFEPAVAFDQLGYSIKRNADPFTTVQHRYAKEAALTMSAPVSLRSLPSRYVPLEKNRGVIRMGLCAFQIFDKLKPCGYVALFSGYDLMPLIVNEIFGSEEKKYLRSVCHWGKGDFAIPGIHPIL